MPKTNGPKAERAQLSIVFDAAERDRLQEIADRTGRTLTDLIRITLKRLTLSGQSDLTLS